MFSRFAYGGYLGFINIHISATPWFARDMLDGASFMPLFCVTFHLVNNPPNTVTRFAICNKIYSYLLAHSADNPQRIRVASVIEISVLCSLFSVCSLFVLCKFSNFTPPGGGGVQ